jgi:hypothetical protein
MSAETENYNSAHVVVKGHAVILPAALADIGGCNILLNQAGLMATPAKIQMTCANVADDSDGTGAQAARLYGLGPNKLYQEELLATNGQAYVESTKTWYRLFIAKVETFGTGKTNAGLIYFIKTGTGGVLSGNAPSTWDITSALAVMLAGTSQATSCFYTTPDIAGGLWRVQTIDLSARTQAGTALIQIEDLKNAKAPRREFYTEFPAGISVQLDVSKYNIVVGPDVDIRAMAIGASSGAVVHCGMTIECLTAIEFTAEA